MIVSWKFVTKLIIWNFFRGNHLSTISTSRRRDCRGTHCSWAMRTCRTSTSTNSSSRSCTSSSSNWDRSTTIGSSGSESSTCCHWCTISSRITNSIPLRRSSLATQIPLVEQRNLKMLYRCNSQFSLFHFIRKNHWTTIILRGKTEKNVKKKMKNEK